MLLFPYRWNIYISIFYSCAVWLLASWHIVFVFFSSSSSFFLVPAHHHSLLFIRLSYQVVDRKSQAAFTCKYTEYLSCGAFLFLSVCVCALVVTLIIKHSVSVACVCTSFAFVWKRRRVSKHVGCTAGHADIGSSRCECKEKDGQIEHRPKRSRLCEWHTHTTTTTRWKTVIHWNGGTTVTTATATIDNLTESHNEIWIYGDDGYTERTKIFCEQTKLNRFMFSDWKRSNGEQEELELN